MLLYDNFFGVGFWGTQYEFNFLPDSGLQFFGNWDNWNINIYFMSL